MTNNDGNKNLKIKTEDYRRIVTKMETVIIQAKETGDQALEWLVEELLDDFRGSTQGARQ